MATAFIGMGSNVGDRQLHLERAQQAMAGLPETRVAGMSRTYETEPVGPTPQGRFLNAVAQLETQLEPEELRASLAAIERAQGRPEPEQRPFWGPRTLDLDLLLYDDQVIETATLTVPHPRMHQRRFVLEPLADLAPDRRHPVLGQTVRQLLQQVMEAEDR